MPSQERLILEYYKGKPGESIPHAEVVDWATEQWGKKTGKKFRDPDRAIRKLFQRGELQKIKKGVYKYDPTLSQNKQLEDFSENLKKIILKKGKYKCAVCGKTERDGVSLHVDHIKAKDSGGRATVENGQVLCAAHNFQKKNYGQYTFGYQLFRRLAKDAEKNRDLHMRKFCNEILALYKKHDLDH